MSKDTSLSGASTLRMTASATLSVERGAESWQFFAFVFGALLATAFAFIDEVPDVRWRIGLKVVASLLIAYFTLLSPRGRNFLVGVLNRFKTVEKR
jgi:hypothetical protein